MTERLAQQRRTRTLQIGFLVVLAVCVAQLAYWLVDEVRYTTAVTAERLERLQPDPATGAVAPEAIARVNEHAQRRRNRYFWEGAFFLGVLLAAMAVVHRAVREEAELRQRQENFLAAVSHELKSPLASLRLSAETLALRDATAERRLELVRRLLSDVDRLQRTIANVLDVSRLAAPTVGGVRESVNLADAVADAMRELEGIIAEGAVRVHVDVAADARPFAQPDAVRSVLRNLLHNALRAVAANGRIDITAARVGATVQLDVADNGAGFPSDKAERLFEKFYRLEGQDGGRAGGTGLGLYIVRRLVALDRGSVRAESTGLGHGARFTVRWPVAGESAA